MRVHAGLERMLKGLVSTRIKDEFGSPLEFLVISSSGMVLAKDFTLCDADLAGPVMSTFVSRMEHLSGISNDMKANVSIMSHNENNIIFVFGGPLAICFFIPNDRRAVIENEKIDKGFERIFLSTLSYYYHGCYQSEFMENSTNDEDGCFTGREHEIVKRVIRGFICDEIKKKFDCKLDFVLLFERGEPMLSSFIQQEGVLKHDVLGGISQIFSSFFNCSISNTLLNTYTLNNLHERGFRSYKVFKGQICFEVFIPYSYYKRDDEEELVKAIYDQISKIFN